VLALRTRLAFLSYQAAEEALPRVLQIMKEELKWSEERVERERQKAIKLIEVDMGKNSKQISKSSIVLTADEVADYTEKFRCVDHDGKGFITRLDITKLMEEMNVTIEEKTMQKLINEIDLNNNGKVELDEFLMLMSDLKHGNIRSNALTTILRQQNGHFPCEKSGGGV